MIYTLFAPLMRRLVDYVDSRPANPQAHEEAACMQCNAAIATGDARGLRPHNRVEFLRRNETAAFSVLPHRPITRSKTPCPLCGSSSERRQAVLVVPN